MLVAAQAWAAMNPVNHQVVGGGVTPSSELAEVRLAELKNQEGNTKPQIVSEELRALMEALLL